MKNHDVELKAAEQSDNFDTDVLIAALRGDINILRWMHDTLAERGFSAETGKHIGYTRAQDELHDRWAGEDMDIYG